MKTVSGVLRFAVLALLLLTAEPAHAADNLLTTPGAATRAVKEIVAKIGREPAVAVVDVTPGEIILQVQGEKPFHVDEWRWQRLEVWYFERTIVSGPNPIRPTGPVDDVSASFFPLADVALDRLPDVVAAAIARAALEDEVEVDHIRIERQVSIFPDPSYGEPRWSVSVTSGREHATVYAALDGKIIGAEVSGTQRARTFNMLTDDARLGEAKADLDGALGPDVRVLEVSFSKSGISARTEHPSKKDYTVSYYWDLNGVRRNPIDSPAMGRMGSNDEEADLAFTVGDLDFSVLPGLKKAALDKLKMDSATISSLTAEKQATGLRPPELVWIVDVENDRGEKGQVIADPRGTILEVLEPESRRPKPEWLAGSTIRATLDRIFGKFPKGAKFSNILINDDRAHVEAEDPLKPGEMASFIVDGQTITPFGRPFPNEVFGMGPPQLFTAEELAGYDAATLDRLKQRTLERISLQDGKVSRLTFERGNVFVASPRGQVLVEIRVEAGHRGGRVTYEPDGTELDVVLP